MRAQTAGSSHRTVYAFVLGLAMSAAVVSAQVSGIPQNGQAEDSNARRWRRVAEPAPAQESTTVAQAAPRGPLDEFGQPLSTVRQGPGPQAAAQPPVVPDELTIRPGTYLTVRVDQPLSSDHNQPGDAFSATLIKPLVIDGVVVAQRGQTIAGTVIDAQKAGRVQGVSRLAVQLTELTLVDGQQVPLRTQLVSRTGPTSVGSDAGTVTGTTATGAAIGAMAGWGTGAAIGAGIGAAAGLIGVLATRGHETLIVPEMMLTFRMEAPATVATTRAPQAFRYVEPEDYAQASLESRSAPPPVRQTPPYYYRPAVFYAPGLYPGYWGPGYWGPDAGVYFGPGFYWGGRGYYRAHWR